MPTATVATADTARCSGSKTSPFTSSVTSRCWDRLGTNISGVDGCTGLRITRMIGSGGYTKAMLG